MIGNIFVIFISILTVIGSIPFLLNSNAVEQIYSKLSSPDGSDSCFLCIPIFASSQNNSDHTLPIYETQLLNNIEIRDVDINSKENVLYILGVELKRQNDKVIHDNVIFLVDTNAKKIKDKIMIDDGNLNLDNIQFDDKNNILYGTGTREIENKSKLISTNIIYEISVEDKNNISFNNITTDFSFTESDDIDEDGIIDMDIGMNSGNMYIILDNEGILDRTDVISEEKSQLRAFPNKTIDNRQLYVIPYGNRIVNNPQEKVNYVLFNSIKSSDKDTIFGLNETTGQIIKNYTLPGLNSRNLQIDSNKGILYVLGDYFTYNNDIKGRSKQYELITTIDTDTNKVSHTSLGNSSVNDFIYNPTNNILYAITKVDENSQAQRSFANHFLEINTITDVIKDMGSISFDLDYMLINDISQTIFLIGKDSDSDDNKILSVNVNNK